MKRKIYIEDDWTGRNDMDLIENLEIIIRDVNEYRNEEAIEELINICKKIKNEKFEIKEIKENEK